MQSCGEEGGKGRSGLDGSVAWVGGLGCSATHASPIFKGDDGPCMSNPKPTHTRISHTCTHSTPIGGASPSWPRLAAARAPRTPTDSVWTGGWVGGCLLFSHDVQSRHASNTCHIHTSIDRVDRPPPFLIHHDRPNPSQVRRRAGGAGEHARGQVLRDGQAGLGAGQRLRGAGGPGPGTCACARVGECRCDSSCVGRSIGSVVLLSLSF